MAVQDLFALITTDALMECRDFYVEHFGFVTVFFGPHKRPSDVREACGSLAAGRLRHRIERKVARTSSVKATGCSMAAKWPPASSSLKCSTVP